MTARARRTDPETSHAAAQSVDVNPNQQGILTVFRRYKTMTDQEMVSHYDNARLFENWGKRLPQQSESGMRTRRAELVKKGVIEWNGHKKVLDTGRQARVWALK